MARYAAKFPRAAMARVRAEAAAVAVAKELVTKEAVRAVVRAVAREEAAREAAREAVKEAGTVAAAAGEQVDVGWIVRTAVEMRSYGRCGPACQAWLACSRAPQPKHSRAPSGHHSAWLDTRPARHWRWYPTLAP